MPLLVGLANLLVYRGLGRLGRASEGHGVKFEPFTGGEAQVPSRGVYESELFVFAALFIVFEVFALLLATAIGAAERTMPILFLIGGSAMLLTTVHWFLGAGGGGRGE
jgi:hypothetical protein